MKRRKPGNRYPLIIYKRKWSTFWKITLGLGLVLGFAWWHASVGRIPFIPPPRDRWLFIGAAVSLAFTFFAFYASLVYYVQPFPNYFRLVTPFLRVNISYKRIKSVHPVDLRQLFPPNKQTSSTLSILGPYYGVTSAGVEMTSFPLDEKLLHVFIPKHVFLPHTKGLLLVIPNWLKFSTEIDAYRAAWNDRRSGKKKSKGLLANLKYK